MPRPKQGGAHDLVSIADVGVGVSQTLPVVVALRAARPGQLVYIEQPEIHLHPRAQVAMARLLVNAAKRGVRVVAETHSSLLLLAVQTLVAEGAIEPSLVGLNWFLRSDKDGTTRIQSADLDEAGRFGDWPEDFDEVALDNENRYLSAAEARLAGSDRKWPKSARACWSSTPRLRTAAGETSMHPTSRNCREFLQAVLAICHRMVLTPPIQEEWNRHQSRFARTWRKSMMARKENRARQASASDHSLREAIANVVSDESVAEIIEKDRHLDRGRPHHRPDAWLRWTIEVRERSSGKPGGVYRKSLRSAGSTRTYRRSNASPGSGQARRMRRSRTLGYAAATHRRV